MNPDHSGSTESEPVRLAFCGLVCSTCPIYLATIEQDRSARHKIRESVAEMCSKAYGMDLKAEDISDCDGCPVPGGRLFAGCSRCAIRKCVIRKQIANCALCPDYACGILKKHFALYPDAEARLDTLR